MITKFLQLIFILSVLAVNRDLLACDQMTASVISNVYMGNNQYQITIQYCESVSNGAGSAVTGILIQTSGSGTITGTTTPTFTSNSTGVSISYNPINSNTVQWGEWDDNPNVATFLNNGNPSQCFTIVINTNGPVTQVAISGSSASSNLGGGFTSWFGRFCCKQTLNVPPVTCNSSWTAPQICPGSGPIDLDNSTSLSGVFTGQGVNSSNGIFDPSLTSLPASVTFTVGDASLSCSTTQTISSPYSIAPINDQTICSGQSVNLTASAAASLPCSYVLNLQDSYGDGWQGGANVKLYVNGVLIGTYSLASGSANNITFNVSNGDVITLVYTAGSSYNSENRVRIANSSGTYVYTSNWGPPSGSMGSGITANCGTSSAFNYSWSPSTGLSTASGASVSASPTETTTYTVTATNTTTGCSLSESVTINISGGVSPVFTPVNYVCQFDPVTTLPGVSNNGISGTWSPAFSAANTGTSTYTFTPDPGQCAGTTTMTITTLGAQRIAPLGAQCSVATLNFEALPNPGPSGISYQWQATPPAGMTVSSTNGSGQTFSTQATNTTNTPLTFNSPNNISVTMTIGGVTCVRTFNPTVNPVPFVIDETVSICNGEPFNITPLSAAPNVIPTGTTYTWVVNDNPAVNGESSVSNPQNSIGQTLTTSASGSQQLIYTVTPTSGAAGFCVGNPFTITVDLQSDVLPTFVQVAPLCIDDLVPTLPSTSTNGISGEWTPAIISSSMEGTQIYTFTPAPNSCATTATMTIVTNADPVVSAQDVSVCQNGSVAVTASGANNYSWSPATGLNATIGSSVNFTAGQTTTYTVTGTTSAGCSSTDQVTVTVNPLPVINAGLDQTVCDGVNVSLTASGASSYTWTNAVSNGVSFASPVGVTNYTVTGTNSNGCTGTDQVLVTVNPLPVILAGNDISICEGQGVTLSASGGATYSWDNGVSSGVTFNPNIGTTTYTVTGTTLSGCTGTDQVSVTVNPKPVVSFVPGDVLGCAPFVTTLSNTTPNSVECVWTISTGEIISGCGTVTVEFLAPGCYDITLTTTDINQCSSSLVVNDLICVEAPPIAQFSSSNSVLTLLDTEVDFYNESIGANNYEWNFGTSNQVSFEENPSYTFPYDETGDYTIMLVAFSELGCSDTAFGLITINEELLFYVPNTFTPDDDDYNQTFKPIFTSGFDPQDYVMYIFNRWGQLIFESRNASVGWDGSYGTWDQSANQIAMSSDGTYTWKIEFKTSKDDRRKMILGHVNIVR
jgi:gliding motility-associated-like protein